MIYLLEFGEEQGRNATHAIVKAIHGLNTKQNPSMNSAEVLCSELILPGFRGKYSSKSHSNPQIQELSGHASERRKEIHTYFKTPFSLYHQFSGKETETLRSQGVGY